MTNYNWRNAQKDLETVLGDKLLVPPHPPANYITRMDAQIRQWGMTSIYIKALGSYCLTNLTPPYEIGFVITQAPRIIGGAFDNKKGPAPTRNWMNDRLPD